MRGEKKMKVWKIIRMVWADPDVKELFFLIAKILSDLKITKEEKDEFKAHMIKMALKKISI